jgi:lactate racemase
MKARLKYGRSDIGLSFADKQVMGVYRPVGRKPLKDLNQAVRKALARPIGTKRLVQMARPGHKVVILVDDATRSVPTAELLVPIVDELTKAGVPKKNICALVAAGLHRKMKRKELDAVLGPLEGKIRIINHDPDKNLTYLGKTRLGTRIYLNRTFMEADIKILTGDVEFHQFCGYGGGAKSVHPGVADSESIRLVHSRMELKGTGPGRIKGNPVRREIDEVGRMAGVDFIVNVVLNPANEVAKVVCGDVIEAFLAGTAVCDKIYRIEVPNRADVVIASAGGFPKDIDLYQAQKALQSAKHIVKKRGKIILLAECREGHGSPLSLRWAREAGDVEDIIRRLRKKFVMGGHKAYQLATAVEWADVYVYSALKANVVRQFFMHPLSNIDEIYNVIGDSDTVAVLPQASATLATLKHNSRPAATHRRGRTVDK